MADFLAKQICMALPASVQSGPLRILDPASGDGELLLALLRRLSPPSTRRVEVHGFDTDPAALKAASLRIGGEFPDAILHLSQANFLRLVPAGIGDMAAPSFRAGGLSSSFDLVIANPPYVRTQILGSGEAQSLAKAFALSGRVDLSHAFIVHIAATVRQGGFAGLIVSNRFMTTKSGAAVREAIRRHFRIHHVWDLGDTRLFEAAVLPALLLLEKSSVPAGGAPRFTSLYRTSLVPVRVAVDLIDGLACEGTIETGNGQRFSVTQGHLDLTAPPAAVWRVSSANSDGWLARVEANTWRCFGEIGTIRVGVKSCADSVFIRADWDAWPARERPELLRPVITHHVARPFRARPVVPVWQILYPHEVRGGQRQAVDLAAYPRARRYLSQHRARLEGRRYVVDSGRQWYELWVPQDPLGWEMPKLVFRDISQQPMFWMELGGCVVNGDCYWLNVGPNGNHDLLWLAAAVANSSFIEQFYDHRFNNKLYAGRRRFIKQYVEHFPLPDPALKESQELIRIAKDLYRCGDDAATRKWAPVIERLLNEVFLRSSSA